MKRQILVALVAFSLAPFAFGATVVGTKHDMRAGGANVATTTTQVCVFCHTPHQASTVTQDPLWNHKASTHTGSYGAYTSITMEHTAGSIAATTMIGNSTNYSSLCMSCHDGTIGVAEMYNGPNEGFGLNGVTMPSGFDAAGKLTTLNTANLGTDLTNDHPIGFVYDSALDTGLNATTSVTDYLIGGNVECSSCHDPHDSTFDPFLTADNAASALCVVCHKK